MNERFLFISLLSPLYRMILNFSFILSILFLPVSLFSFKFIWHSLTSFNPFTYRNRSHRSFSVSPLPITLLYFFASLSQLNPPSLSLSVTTFLFLPRCDSLSLSVTLTLWLLFFLPVCFSLCVPPSVCLTLSLHIYHSLSLFHFLSLSLSHYLPPSISLSHQLTW